MWLCETMWPKIKFIALADSLKRWQYNSSIKYENDLFIDRIKKTIKWEDFPFYQSCERGGI